jgi:ABC-type nitrate/sulfonate/bicarbonate transport system permease component
MTWKPIFIFIVILGFLLHLIIDILEKRAIRNGNENGS